MINFKYLYTGLCGLANAHKAGTMAGHLGAAVVTGYFFGEDQNGLVDPVYRGVEGELERILRGEEAIWFNAAEIGLSPLELFQTLPTEPADAKLIPSIAQALAENGEQLIESGHNVIFASIAIRALSDHPEYATPTLVTGIRRLIESFKNAYPGRGYYGKERGWLKGDQVELAPDDSFPVYADLQELVNVTIAELIGTAPIRRQGFGGLWHVINHAAAITELDRYGHKPLAQRALAGHHAHVRLWRSLPDVSAELGPATKAALSPLAPEFWQGDLHRDQARLTHRIKTLYGFYTLMRHVTEATVRQQAEDAFLYLMS